MHERRCKRICKKKIKIKEYSTVMDVGGINNTFNHLESALGGVFQTSHPEADLVYILSDCSYVSLVSIAGNTSKASGGCVWSTIQRGAWGYGSQVRSPGSRYEALKDLGFFQSRALPGPSEQID